MVNHRDFRNKFRDLGLWSLKIPCQSLSRTIWRIPTGFDRYTERIGWCSAQDIFRSEETTRKIVGQKLMTLLRDVYINARINLYLFRYRIATAVAIPPSRRYTIPNVLPAVDLRGKFFRISAFSDGFSTPILFLLAVRWYGAESGR